MTLSIARRAAHWGDRTAVVDVSEGALYAPAATVDADRVSYAALSALAGATAEALADRDVEAGDTVAVLSRNRVAVLALAFACRRLGATLAPVSHRLTPATVERPLSRLAPTLVVHERAQRDLVRTVSVDRTEALDDLGATVADVPSGDSAGATADADPAGTAPDRRRQRARDGAGAPLLALHGEAGAPVARFDAAAVEWNCVTAVATRGLGRADRTILTRPLSSYDGLLGVALPALYVGGRLVLDRAFDPGDAATAMRREGATYLAGRATEFRDLLARDGIDEALASVEWIAWEGAVDHGVASGYLERGVPVVRTYGRLECPNALATRPAGEGIADRGVGRPVLDCDARLVEDGRVVTGPGEGVLELGGPVLATDYAGDPSPVDPAEARGTGGAEDPGTGGTDAAQTTGADDAATPSAARGFADGRFRTGERFRRDEHGRYHPVDGDGD